MCGFFGVHYFNSRSERPKIELSAVLETIRHRGPDDQGYFQDENTYLGFNRLSIIDLSNSGHQPMSSRDGDIHLVFNGEIFNYIELRRELREEGCIFSSATDSEVIIHAYDKHGTDCLPEFNGMWGFALYDSSRKRLFCSRDRFGIKPFYYYIDDEKIIFASEIKAIIKAGVKAEPDDSRIFRYLAYGQLDIDEKTMFKNIYQLPPGHFMVVENGKLQISRFWNLPDERISQYHDRGDDMLEQFRELFFSALSLRLRSDVPVGALLSGGLDSSAIVSAIGLLAQEKNTDLDIRTFTATYDEKAIDESGFALDVVRQTGIKNILVYPGSDGKLSTEIEKVIHHQDEPPLTMTAFAHWYLMKEISKHDIKVILSGQGADEMFGGYVEQFAGYFLKDLLFLKKFKTFFAETKLLKSRSGLTSGIILMQLVKAIMSRRIALVFKSLLREKAIQHLNRDFTKKHWGWSDIATGPDLKHSSALNGKLFRAFSSESLPRILHYEDRNSMAFSIEQRMPFLDYRLVEFAFSLANQWKMNSGIGKVILRRALQGVMPDTIVKRFSKLGFTVPQNRWINEMVGYVNQLFSTRSFRQRPYWDADRIIKMYSDNRTKKSGMDIFLWRVIACEVWLNKFFARG